MIFARYHLLHKGNVMQLRREGLQFLVLLMTLTAFEGGSTAEPSLWPCPPPPVRNAVAVTPQPNAICLAALSGLRELPDLVTDKNAPMLGFKDKAEVASVKYGEPFKLYQVDLVDLRRFKPATDKVKDLLKDTSLWIWPILTEREDGIKARSAVVVSPQKDNTVKPTNWGLAQLTQAMTKYREETAGFAHGVIVWIPALNLHFLANNPDNEDPRLIPLADRLAYGIRKGEPISAKLVFTFYAREASSLDENNPG
jgi:hypothetical protein